MDNKVRKSGQPMLRFNEFSKQWNCQVFEKEVQIFTGLTYSPSNVIESPGTLVLRSSNVKKGRIALFDNVYVNSDVVNSTNVEVGDIIVVVRNGSRRLIGKHAIINQKMPNTVIGAFMTGLRPKQSNFINALLDTKSFSKQIKRNLGATINQITIGSLRSMSFMFPGIPEQKKIGSFFQNIDNLITLHQKKYDKLIILKKAMLMKMFPREGEVVPEIRFKGFEGDWSRMNWKDTVDISNNMVDPKSEIFDELYHIGPGNIESFTGMLKDNILKVKESNLISGKFLFKEGDIIYGKINPQLAKFTFALYSGLASADSYILNAKNDLDQRFLYVILQTSFFFKYSVSVSARTGMPKINREELNLYYFLAPSINEQKKIGEYFKELDSLILFHYTQLNQLTNIKKACLSKMFVAQN